ncbi:MAG: hypothetical protein CME63_12600 [Halobacteriovoraceae bacterium]|jgi:hypothetical protein|nr:hypothetical protein [Halobacteriovoraceae bacterium]|tara:strand:+ start:5608 stop:5901 length:294 start_codon:yes stop_codon:yes gene_type:complete
MELKEKLSSEVLETNWKPLAEHFARGVVYYLEPELDLVEVGESMATDSVSQIKRWLDDGLIYTPTPQQATQFHEDQDIKFDMLIIEPYVLIQQKGLS